MKRKNFIVQKWSLSEAHNANQGKTGPFTMKEVGIKPTK